jgi:hypothetical protein
MFAEVHDEVAACCVVQGPERSRRVVERAAVVTLKSRPPPGSPLTLSCVEISVETSGGMFPVHRVVEIDERTVRVTETAAGGHETVQREAPLARADAEQLQELARRVTAAGDQIDEASAGVDGATTQLRVDDGQASSRVEIREGWDTKAEVWDLLDAVDRVTPKV